MLKWLFKRNHKRPEDTPFQLESKIGYLLFGYGTLPATDDKGIHYIRLRPYLGKSDPCLPGWVQDRARIKGAILSAERRERYQAVWRSLLGDPPTHILRFGWKSRKTGVCHDLIYLPLCFRRSGYHTDGLAREFGELFLAIVERNRYPWYLCPSSKMRIDAAVFWLGATFTAWIESL